MSSVSASGIAADFPKVPLYLKEKMQFGFSARHIEERLAFIERLANEGPGFEYLIDDEEFDYSMHDLGDDLWAVFVSYRHQAIQLALTGTNGWEKEWRRALVYGYWALVMQMDARLVSIEQGAATGGVVWGAPMLEWFGGITGDCLALGWNDYARDLAKRSRWMAQMRGFPDGGEDYHRATQRFVLRLCESEDGAAEASPLAPEFAALLESWDSSDVTGLAPLLLAACDRHTHQCRSTETNEEFDLPFEAFWYDPYEILGVLQLRTSNGLASPVLDHPLLDTPLGRLQAPSAPVLDATLAAAISRMQRA